MRMPTSHRFARGVAGVNGSKADLSRSRAQINNAIAERERISAQLGNARETLKRNDQLFKDGVISQAELQASQTEGARI